MAQARIEFAAQLRFFLSSRNRHGEVTATLDGTSSLGHLIESFGVPLPEVGGLSVDGRTVPASHRPEAGELIRVSPMPRPQPVPVSPPRFLLDVHLGALARRMRLAGIDTAYDNDADDPALVEQANAARRVLLTQDRGLLRRRRLWLGAYVRGAGPDAQFRDVLDRFAPPLMPWTRCMACNGLLEPVGKESIGHLLEPGTRRTYDEYARCRDCGKPYWKGAHHRRLEAIVAVARRTVGARTP